MLLWQKVPQHTPKKGRLIITYNPSTGYSAPFVYDTFTSFRIVAGIQWAYINEVKTN